MRRHISKLEALQESWLEKAKLALSKDREDLAKAALLEKQKAADMADQMKVEIATLAEALKANEEDLKKLHTKLLEARARQHSIVTRPKHAHTPPPVREQKIY